MRIGNDILEAYMANPIAAIALSGEDRIRMLVALKERCAVMEEQMNGVVELMELIGAEKAVAADLVLPVRDAVDRTRDWAQRTIERTEMQERPQ